MSATQYKLKRVKESERATDLEYTYEKADIFGYDRDRALKALEKMKKLERKKRDDVVTITIGKTVIHGTRETATARAEAYKNTHRL